ncbi:MAG: ABC transporter permease subunit [Streptococcus salivarius]
MLVFSYLPFFVPLLASLCVSAAYMAEIFRSSIVAVDKGQWEAARSLGLPQKSIIRRIILPQAMRIAVALL